MTSKSTGKHDFDLFRNVVPTNTNGHKNFDRMYREASWFFRLAIGMAVAWSLVLMALLVIITVNVLTRAL